MPNKFLEISFMFFAISLTAKSYAFENKNFVKPSLTQPKAANQDAQQVQVPPQFQNDKADLDANKKNGSKPHQRKVTSRPEVVPVKLYSASPIFYPDKNDIKIKNSKLKPGDILKASLDHELIASNVSAPVRVRITEGKYVDSIAVGDASLDREYQRIFIKFHTLRLKQGDYKVKAEGLSVLGSLGLGKEYGEFKSDEGKLFAATLLSSFISGISNGLKEKTIYQTPFGEMEKTGTGSLIKNAAIGGISEASERTSQFYAEKLKNAPAISKIDKDMPLAIFINEEPEKFND